MLTSQELDQAKSTEDEYFYLSMREEVFDTYFTFSKRLEEFKDMDYFDYQDIYEGFWQKKVHFIGKEEITKFEAMFKKAIQLYFSAINSRVEESPISCSVVRVNTSLNSQIALSVWLFYEFQAEELIGTM